MWFLLMIGLILATIIVGLRESKARARATKQIMSAPSGIPMSDAGSPDLGGAPSADDGFGQTDVEFAQFDEKNFK